jgi:hypothetical protein
MAYTYKEYYAKFQWLTPVILVTQEAEIRRSQFKATPGK